MAIQDKFNRANVIYKITKDIDLGGETLTIPEGCTLDFQGGSFSNGTIVGNGTVINNIKNSIFDVNISLKGKIANDFILPEWFGAIGDGEHDDLPYINKAIKEARVIDATVKLHNKKYAINGTIILGTNTRLHGEKVLGRFSDNTQIIQKGNFNVIEINNIKAFNDTVNYYTNISIKNITIDMGGHLVSGIYHKREEDDINYKVFQFCHFSNIYIKNGFNGIYMHFTEKLGGMLYCNFSNIIAEKNIVGLHLDGGSFINLNTFNSCCFILNKNIGIKIKGSAIENNKFTSCSIESNGKDYNEEAYKEYGSSGVTLIGRKGYNTFDNCYFEDNYPVKNNNCPLDMDENFYVANVVCQGVTFVSRNSLFSAYNRGINVGDTHCGIILENNDYWNPAEMSKNNAFVKIWNNTFKVVYGYQQFNFSDGARSIINLKYAFEFEKDSTTDLINYCIIDNSKFLKSNNIEVRGDEIVSDSIKFYIDGVTDGTGFTEKVAAKSLESIKTKNGYTRNVSKKTIHILGQCESGTQSSAQIIGDTLIIKGYKEYNSALTFNSFLYNWNVNNVIFEDLTINLVSTYGLRLDGIKNIIINNCIINYKGEGGRSLFRTNDDNPIFTNIVLNKTTINDTPEGSTHSHLCSGNPKLFKFHVSSDSVISESIHLDDCDNIDYNRRDVFYMTYPNGYLAYDKTIGGLIFHNNGSWYSANVQLLP